MSYYHLTVKRSNAIHLAVSGDFLGNGKKQIVTSSGKCITLWKITTFKKKTTVQKYVVSGKCIINKTLIARSQGNFPTLRKCRITRKVNVDKLLEVDVFGYIRSMKKFWHTVEKKDFLIVTSDSGKLVVLSYRNNTFEKVYEQTLSEAGSGRTTLGHYLAVDCKSRAVMIGALEDAKIVMVISKITTKEYPLGFADPAYDASTEKTLIFDMVPVGSQKNIVFACLEARYKNVYPDQELSGVPKQFVSFYQVETTTKRIEHMPLEDLTEYGNFLITVPSDSGVLLFASNCIIYLHRSRPALRCPIPRRVTEITERPMIFVCATTCKRKGTYFFLAQTEQGDIFKITLGKLEDQVWEIELKYFTTVHIASALIYFCTGYLFVASEFGNHYLYRVLGFEDDGPEFSSSVCLDKNETFFFFPKALKNLLPVKEFQSLSPIMQLEMTYPEQDKAAYLGVACGRGPSSSLRMFKRRSKNPDNELFSEISRKGLEHTPRKFVLSPMLSAIFLIETDHNSYTMKTQEFWKNEMLMNVFDAATKYNLMFKDRENLKLIVEQLLWRSLDYNIPNIYQCESGMWASVLRMLYFHKKQTGITVTEMVGKQLLQNEAAFSIALVKFASQGDAQYLLVGVNKLESDTPAWKDPQSGMIYTYKVLYDRLQLVHKTVVEDCPTAMCPFQGYVLIGVGGVLKIYDFCEVMLFVKYERNLCNRIVSIHNFIGDNHIYVGDIKDGFLYLLFRPEVNEKESRDEMIIEVFAEDVDPSWITTACFLGFNKLARADKFGNIFIVRLPSEKPYGISPLESAVNKMLPKKYPAKVDMLATFHVGEMVTSMQVGKFIPQTTSEVLVYATLSGSIGMLAPIEKGDEATLLNFEMLMRVTNPPLCGRDHLAFRSYYFPALNVIDGDLLEQYYSLPGSKRGRLIQNIHPTPIEVLQKMRIKHLGDEYIIPEETVLEETILLNIENWKNQPSTSSDTSRNIPEIVQEKTNPVKFQFLPPNVKLQKSFFSFSKEDIELFKDLSRGLYKKPLISSSGTTNSSSVVELHPTLPEVEPLTAYPVGEPLTAYPVGQPLTAYPPIISSSEPTNSSSVVELHTALHKVEPHSAYSVGEPHTAYAIGEPHTAYAIGEPHTAYPVEESHSAYPGEEPHTAYPVEEPHTAYPVEESHTAYLVEESHTAYPVEEPHSAYPGQEPHTAYPVVEQYSAFAVVEPHTVYPVMGLFSAFPVVEPHTAFPTSFPAVQQYTAFPAVQQYTAFPAVQQHTAFPAVQQPTAFPAVEQNTAFPQMEQHAAFPAVQQHAAFLAVEQNTVFPPVEQPTTFPVVEQYTIFLVEDPPTAPSSDETLPQQ